MSIERKEEWRPVEGYEGRYEVSNMGRVRSLDMVTRAKHNSLRKAKGRTLKPSMTQYGYLQVQLADNGAKKHVSIHRLVARAFPEICGEWFEGCQINHRNEVKTDNRACNLETCTHIYNINYGTHNQRCAKNRSKAIEQLTIEGVFIKQWESTMEASLSLGLSYTSITNMLHGRSKTAGGYQWQYAKG